ncbi:hypothetical protein FKM82_000561 [Ascaphus truei]
MFKVRNFFNVLFLCPGASGWALMAGSEISCCTEDVPDFTWTLQKVVDHGLAYVPYLAIIFPGEMTDKRIKTLHLLGVCSTFQ